MSLSRSLQYLFLAIIVTTVGFSLYQWNASRASTQKTAPNNGLVGYWSFNEGTGTLAGDASVNKNTGTLTNGPTWVSGKLGQAVSFDAVDDYIDAGTSSSLMPAFPFSISTWVMDGGVITTADPANNGEYSGYILIMGAGGITAQIGDNNGYCSGARRNTYTTNATTLTAGRWYHVTAVFTNASSFSIFVNGASVTTTQSGTNGLSIGYAAGARFRIARYFAACGGTTSYSGGKVDEVRIYNRALSGTEITNLYNLGAEKLNVSPVSNLTSGLVGYWTFDGKDTPWSSSSAGTATDRSGNSNTGTLTNMSQSTSVIRGQLGQALNFDGVNDYVNVAHSTALNVGGTSSSYSASVWFKTTQTARVDLISKYDVTAPTNTSPLPFLLDINSISAGQVRFLYRGTGGGGDSSSILSDRLTYNDGNWHHAVVTIDRNTNMSILTLDGISKSQSIVVSTDMSNSYAVNIGALDNDGSFLYGKSTIDEVRIYNRALSVTEVQSLYDLGASDKVNSSVSQNQGTGRLDSGLVGYWKLDDASGTTATDSSVNANNGTLTNGPTWGTGQVKGDTVFDGTDDYVNMGSTNINLSATFSISGWIKANSARSQHRIILSKGVKNTGHYEVFIMTGTGELRFYSNDIGDLASGYIIDDNIWHYFSVVYNGTTMNFYVDGVLRASPSASGSIPNETETFYLGRQVDGGGDPMYFNGSIDEVRIYNRALSADEVSQLYRLTTPTGVDTSLKGYWSFDGSATNWTSSSAGTVSDLSGSGNTGTMTNMSQSTSVIRGKLGQALFFDGSNDYVNTGITSNTLFSNTTFSVSAWFKTTVSTGVIIAKQDSTAGGWAVNFAGSSLSAVHKGTAGGNVLSRTTTATGLNDGNWHHIAFTMTTNTSGTAGQNIDIYLDGALNQGSLTNTAAIVTVANAVYIGDRYNTSIPWTGSIDEVRIYNRALTATEITALYNSGR